MKRITIILMMALGTACTSLINLEPVDSYSFANMWNNSDEALSSVMGVYGELRSVLKYNYAHWGEGRAWDVICDNGNLETSRLQYNRLSSTMDSAYWNELYYMIGRANLCIKFIPGIEDPSFTHEARQALVSEASFLRALAYFYIVRVWGDAPLVVEPTMSLAEVTYPCKDPKDKIMEQIYKDLETAAAHLPLNYSDSDNGESARGRATLGAAYALLADVHMWNHNYAEAVNAINSLEKLGSKAPKYTYATRDEWKKMFFSSSDIPGAGNSVESIFELQYNVLEDALSGFKNLWSGSAYYRPSEDWIDFITTRGGDDIRADATYPYDRGYEVSIIKYTGVSGEDYSGTLNYDNNLIIYRWSDIQLLKAEALNRTGKKQEAIKILETLRKNRFLTNAYKVPLTKDSSMDEIELLILEERSIELFGEGKRWFDLVRTGRVGELINPLLKDNKITDADNYYWPVGVNVIRENPNIEQNPYYLSAE